jgi:hypothetical protein
MKIHTGAPTEPLDRITYEELQRIYMQLRRQLGYKCPRAPHYTRRHLIRVINMEYAKLLERLRSADSLI